MATDQRDLSHSKVLRIGGKAAIMGLENRQHTTLENLAPFTNYSVMVSAETEEGEGPYSYPIYCSTQVSSKHINFLS